MNIQTLGNEKLCLTNFGSPIFPKRPGLPIGSWNKHTSIEIRVSASQGVRDGTNLLFNKSNYSLLPCITSTCKVQSAEVGESPVVESEGGTNTSKLKTQDHINTPENPSMIVSIETYFE